ncbi:MAG TPA: hypothetical protein VHF25_08195 [Nitriliruptorales bacterium]|nr:hypothetical protein [Nitriliruptorales bacterium]
MMKVWPFGIALRGEVSNRLMLRWLKTVVVSDEEKAHGMRQVGIGKTSASEPLVKRREDKVTSKPGSIMVPGMSLAVARIVGQVVSGVGVA